ncbi:MAG TPA: cyclic nucleotide-binding domain-containing protein [bacterium]
MVDIEKLKGFSLFKHLNERELEQIAQIAEEESSKKDMRIFEEKALAVNLYLVLEGRVELKISGDGKEKIVIDTAGPGDIFGWSAVTDPHTFTAAA